MKVILDTNFLITAAKYKIDIFEQLIGNELFLTETVENELKKLKTAKIAREIIESKGLKVLKSKLSSADPDLIEFGKEGYAIATQDKILKEKLKKLKIKVLYIRQRKYVTGD